MGVQKWKEWCIPVEGRSRALADVQIETLSVSIARQAAPAPEFVAEDMWIRSVVKVREQWNGETGLCEKEV